MTTPATTDHSRCCGLPAGGCSAVWRRWRWLLCVWLRRVCVCMCVCVWCAIECVWCLCACTEDMCGKVVRAVHLFLEGHYCTRSSTTERYCLGTTSLQRPCHVTSEPWRVRWGVRTTLQGFYNLALEWRNKNRDLDFSTIFRENFEIRHQLQKYIKPPQVQVQVQVQVNIFIFLLWWVEGKEWCITVLPHEWPNLVLLALKCSNNYPKTYLQMDPLNKKVFQSTRRTSTYIPRADAITLTDGEHIVPQPEFVWSTKEIPEDFVCDELHFLSPHAP